MSWNGPYFYKDIKGWDASDTKYEVYIENWEDKLVAIFYDEMDANRYVREKNEEFQKEKR